MLHTKQHVFSSHVHLEVEGDSSLGELLRMVDDAYDASQAWRPRRLLLDLRQVPPPDPVGQAMVGDHLAARLGHLKIASLVEPGNVTRHSERAAVRAGGHVKVFGNEAAATQWLLDEQA